MEEELQKRNTDCVYFLASPLTCKKGIECEYRHSDIARLNPRDCWYWLAGSCLNPTCAFRHPPLDGRNETVSESATTNSQSALPVNKTNVPCFYYYNGFCSKGERCFFVHGPDGNAHSWKASKQASVAVDEQLLKKKMPKGTDSGPAPAEISSFGTNSKSTAGTKAMPEQKFKQPSPDNTAERSACPQISESPSEEAATIRSNSPIHTEGLVQRISHESTDQSPDNQLDDHIKQEDWLESSPGFDVLVNDRSEDLDYEDEALYTLCHDVEEREGNGQHLRYDYEDNIEYDPKYPDMRFSFERGLPDYYGHLDEAIYDTTKRTPFPARESLLDCTLQQKRGLLQTELSSVDLRDYLKKRRMAESRHSNIYSGGHHSSCLVSKITEKAYIRERRLHGRLASEVEISVESRIQSKPHRSGTYQHSRTRHALAKRSRKQTKERKQGKWHISSEISGKTASRKRRSVEDSTTFTGPKTLAQLKKEKKEVLGCRDFCDETEPSSSKA